MRFIKDNTVRIQRTLVSTLDKLDRHILDLLQRDGRMSMTELADAVGLTVTPCIERVRRLERDGVITGDRRSVGEGKSVSVRVDLGGRGSMKKKQERISRKEKK